MKDDTAALGRNFPEFVVFSIVTIIGGVLFANAFQQPWYFGVLIGPLVAALLCGPRKVLRTLAEQWGLYKTDIRDITGSLVLAISFLCGWVATSYCSLAILAPHMRRDLFDHVVFNFIIVLLLMVGSGAAWAYIYRFERFVFCGAHDLVCPLSVLFGLALRHLWKMFVKERAVLPKQCSGILQFAWRGLLLVIEFFVRGIIICVFGMMILPCSVILLACDVAITGMLHMAVSKQASWALCTCIGIAATYSHPEFLGIGIPAGFLVGDLLFRFRTFMVQRAHTCLWQQYLKLD